MSYHKLLYNFKSIGDETIGYLSFFEANKDIPIEIKRVYYTYNVPNGTKRGMHAHKNLKQILWCPYGAIEIILDDGVSKYTYLLDKPEIGLFVGNGIWRDMYWKVDNSVLCVVASDYYNEDDYIRDYDEFLNYVKEGYWGDEY